MNICLAIGSISQHREKSDLLCRRIARLFFKLIWRGFKCRRVEDPFGRYLSSYYNMDCVSGVHEYCGNGALIPLTVFRALTHTEEPVHVVLQTCIQVKVSNSEIKDKSGAGKKFA
jgi:hypothetical protein